MIADRRLTANFRLHEFLQSDTAERYAALNDMQYNPPHNIVKNIEYLCGRVLQPIRSKLGYSIGISSGWRSSALNRKIGGAETSQHLNAEAADISLSASFLQDPVDAYHEVETEVHNLFGYGLRYDVNANFLLFAYIVLHLEELDVDQVIHEYGTHRGAPAWVHVSASRAKDKREIMCIGNYTDRRIKDVQRVDKRTALSWGV